MNYKKDNKFDDEFISNYIDSDTVELINHIEEKNTAELRAYIKDFFTPLEIETMKYIAQGLKSEQIAHIQNTKKTSIDRRKERIIEKTHKYMPEMVIDKKQILTIKNIVRTFHLLDGDDSENTFIDRLKDFIKIEENK